MPPRLETKTHPAIPKIVVNSDLCIDWLCIPVDSLVLLDDAVILPKVGLRVVRLS
jgi:hypothetical protein